MNSAPLNGIMGIGLVNQTNIPSSHLWYWSLYYSGQLASPAVSFYFPPRKVDGAEMTLGGIDPNRYKGDIAYADLAGDKSMYMVS